MRRTTRRPQFRLWHILVATMVFAILVQPTTLLVTRLMDHFRRPDSTIVTVPDGGTVLIGGMKFRADGSRVPKPPRRTVSKVEFSMATSTIIIEEEPELVYLPTQ